MFPTKLEGNCKQPRLSSRSSPFNPGFSPFPPPSPPLPLLPCLASLSLPASRPPQPVRAASRRDNPSFDLLGWAETRYQTVMKSLSSTRFLLEPFMHHPARNALIQGPGHYQRVYVTDNAGLSRERVTSLTSVYMYPVYPTIELIVAYPRSGIFMSFSSRGAAAREQRARINHFTMGG